MSKNSLFSIKNYLFIPFNVAPIQTFAIGICNILGFSLDIIFSFLIIFIMQSETQTVGKNITAFVFLIICARFLFSLLEIKLNLSGRKIFFEKISFCLYYINKNQLSAGKLNRIVSRDILALSEQFFLLIEPWEILIETGLLFLAGYIIGGFPGLVGLMGVVILIPASLLIGKLTYYYTEKLFQSAEERIDLTVQWISYRKLAFLMQRQKQALHKIETFFKIEIHLRNMDSLWRSLELYLSVFSRPIPMLFASSLIFFLGFDVQQQAVVIFWLSIPAIELTLRAGRTLATLKVCQGCFNNIKSFILLESETDNQVSRQNENEIICDEHWDIWDDSLNENLCNKGKLPNLLQSLRMDQELSQRGQNIESIILEHFGKNLSQGQRTRVLFGRAINQLLELPEGTLHLYLSLSSLDKDSKLRVIKIINELPPRYKVILSEENKLLLSDSSENNYLKNNFNDNDENLGAKTFNQQDFIREKREKSLLKALLSLSSWPSLIFLFPAFLLGWFGQRTAEIPRDFSTVLMWFLVMVIGVLSAVVAGWMTENKIRTDTLKTYMKLITRRGLEDETDLKQRVISDTSIMLERLSWYTHDLSWMLGVLIVGIVGLLWTAPVASSILILIYFILASTAWLFFSKSVRDARMGFVKSLNIALDKLENLLCFKGVDSSIADLRKKQFSDEAFKIIYKSVSKLTWSKSLLAEIFVFSAGLLLVGVFHLYEQGFLQKPNFLFLLSLLLTIQVQASNLVLALSGFSSQQNSLDRLQEYDNWHELDNCSYLIRAEQANFLVPKRKTLNTLNEAESVRIPMGKILSLVGKSGSGKSTYLKLIAGLVLNESTLNQHMLSEGIPCLYLERDSSNILTWLELINNKEEFTPEFLFSFLLENMSSNKYSFVMLDEVLTVWSLSEAQRFCERLEENLEKLCSAVVVVDHRFSMNSNLHVDELWSSN